MGHRVIGVRREVDDVGEGVVVTNVADENHVGGADGFWCRLDGTEDRHHAGEQLADDLCAADAEAADRDIVGGDSASATSQAGCAASAGRTTS